MRPMTRTQLARLLALPAHALVRVHTFQTGCVLFEAERTGLLAGSADHASYPEAYAWMVERMAAMLPTFSGRHPVWAWLRRPDGRMKMLDRMEDMVRITALVPRGRMVVSDLDMWGNVINVGHVHLDGAENDAYDKAWPDDPEPGDAAHPTHQADMRLSWERIFDPLAAPDHELWGDRRAMPVQACIDGIRIDEIVAVRRYGTLPPRGRR